MNKETLQAISDTAHSINVANGFKEAESRKRSLALIISEMAEMLEADRKGKWSNKLLSDLAMRNSNVMYGMTTEQAHLFILDTDGEFKADWFKETVKDTAEDELADVVIRITSYLAACGYKMQYEQSLFSNIDFKQPVSEIIYDLMKAVTEANKYGTEEEELEGVAYACFEFAEAIGIDLEWHINAKLAYNRTRSYLHGKSY